jgi:uncharacterized membrane protein
MQQIDTGPSVLPDIGTVTVADIPEVLRLGLRDFLRAPAFGIFFSAFYVAGGLVIWQVYSAAGQEWWMVPFFVGFPILGPFAAVGLYEVSRRIEAGAVLDWRAVLGLVFAQRQRQIPSMAAIVVLLFMFWLFVAHALFALFLGLQAAAQLGTSPAVLLQGNGPLMLLLGTVIGAGFAGVLFATTVTGLPLLLEYEVDFVTAMITSVQSVLQNLVPMALWGLTITVLIFAAMVPMFLGLVVVLPVLGHATWHMYRRLMPAA